MKFCLNTKIIEPDNKENIDYAIILLHGYGGDGQDISMLTLGWKRFLKNTVFLCPDASESCTVNPSGYQWFDLSNDDPKYILLNFQEGFQCQYLALYQVKDANLPDLEDAQ